MHGGELILGLLNQHGVVILIVFGVQVGANDVVTEFFHRIEAPGARAALQERRTHVCWDEAKDVAKGHLIVDHFSSLDIFVDAVKVAMSPGVAGQLMPGASHAPQNLWISRGLVVDATFASVASGDEECGLDFVFVEEVKKLVCVLKGSVIECQGNKTRRVTLSDGLRCNMIRIALDLIF